MPFVKVAGTALRATFYRMTKTQDPSSAPSLTHAFARKVWLSKLALFFERLWPRLWLLIALALVFVAVSFLNVWAYLSEVQHVGLISLFAAAALAALVYAMRVPWPSREDAIRRIERRSDVPHRPATSYEDTLSSGGDNPETKALWAAHRDRLARAIARLRVGNPSPRADRFDPLALRLLTVLLIVPAALLASGSLSDRLASAFRFNAPVTGTPTRVDAWVTPPPYTAMAPILLADGGSDLAKKGEQKTDFTVPDKSLLTLRGAGFGAGGVSLEISADGTTSPQIVNAEKPKQGSASDIAEVRYEIRKPSIIRAHGNGRLLGQWTFDVIADKLPQIALTKEISGTPRGSMRVEYKAEDDYGVAGAAVKVKLIPPKPGDPAKAWARPIPLSGPRLPLERPPVLALRIPRVGDKKVQTSSLLEIGEHPWAGQRVLLWLEATDIAGQVGRSKPIELVLPARHFKNPLARAVIEQRRKLAEDSRNREMVAKALDALALEPEGFIEDASVYLGLRNVFHRLERLDTHAAMTESISQLWQLALRIEDGALSDAEKALKDAQDRLSDALQKGGDEKEIQDALNDLKKRLNDYLQQMQKNAEKDNPSNSNQGDDQQQQLGQNDLDQMVKDLERSAKEGSREQAEQMLSQLRELMDRLQAGNTPEARAQQQRAQQMMKKLNELGDLTGKQQQLLDDTFKQRRNGEQPGGSQDDPQAGPNSPSQPGRNGTPGQKGNDGQRPGDERGEGPPGGQSGQRGTHPNSQGTLKDRQAELRDRLDQLKKDLEQMGAGDPDKLQQAEDAMRRAEDALNQNDLEQAGDEQGEALNQMRQSAQKMADQMQKDGQQRLGRGGNAPRDPLGRPQRAQGPDLGTSVKVPDAIDAQRAREILEELRRRSGENLRPPTELDYIDRLLKRFGD